MTFYESENTEFEKNYYRKMLALIGSLSNLFSSSEKPYLASRVTENVFCRYLDAENLSRSDITADARKEHTGIGIKTWVGSSMQKIAEFNSQKPMYENLETEKMIKYVSQLRNDRILFTMRTYDLNKMVYHCTIRDKGIIKVAECPLELIDIDKINSIKKNRNIITFNDRKNNYSFNTSKSTLYKDFKNIQILDTVKVKIIEDPFLLLEQRILNSKDGEIVFAGELQKEKEHVFLPLYTFTKERGKYVQEKAALNARFSGGRKRDIYEAYIAISKEFNRKFRPFFPPSDQPFKLILPNGKELSAKICQQGDKALMTNPNKDLGHWLIDDVFKIDPQELITYEMLEKYGIDSVRITKEDDLVYSIDFAKIGSYEAFMDSSEIDSTGIVDNAGSDGTLDS